MGRRHRTLAWTNNAPGLSATCSPIPRRARPQAQCGAHRARRFLEAQNYYDETVDGEARDQCDLSSTPAPWLGLDSPALERRAGDHHSLRRSAEIRGGPAIAPPNLLYSMPGNIIEGSLRTFWGGNGTPPNTILGEFPDRAQERGLEHHQRGSRGHRQRADHPGDRLPEQHQARNPGRSASSSTSSRSGARSSGALAGRARSGPGQRALRRGYPELRDHEPSPRLSRLLPGGSTTTNLLLDRLVTLEAATTYVVMIRHLADNDTERSTVSTAAGLGSRGAHRGLDHRPRRRAISGRSASRTSTRWMC